MSWYRAYRPTTVSGLHLSSVRQTLQDLMKSGRFPHALLFAGPKGTGKTSSARIIGAMLNDPANATAVDAMFFPKASDSKEEAIEKAFQRIVLQEPTQENELVQRIQRGASFVVMEMDAASNRGIDDIRQLKEKIFLPPQEGKVSVFILDEAHMLTTEAFNALLKILEEPPAHVVFVLATTELHKLPDTIVSRCTVVQFQKATPQELLQSFEQILNKEQIDFEQAVLTEIAKLADGSFRDGVKLLESIAAGKKKITVADLEQVSQLSSEAHVRRFVQILLKKDEKESVEFFEQQRQQGKSENFFHRSLLSYLHAELMKSVGVGEAVTSATLPKKVSHYLLTQFQNLPSTASASIPFLSLELKTLDVIFKAKEKSGGVTSGGGGATSKQPTPNPTPQAKSVVTHQSLSVGSSSSLLKTIDLDLAGFEAAGVSDTSVADTVSLSNVVPVLDNLEVTLETTNDRALLDALESPEPSVNTVTSFVRNTLASDSLSGMEYADGEDLIKKWDIFLQSVRKHNSSIEALLRSSKPVSAEKGKTKIEVYYQFHREQLQQPKFRKMIDECISEVLGGKVLLEYSLAEKSRQGASASDVSGQVNEEDALIKLAKDVLM